MIGHVLSELYCNGFLGSEVAALVALFDFGKGSCEHEDSNVWADCF